MARSAGARTPQLIRSVDMTSVVKLEGSFQIVMISPG
jgi:hypothetical protein